jgi:RimJ/RimL family protein N-acetyltransferase
MVNIKKTTLKSKRLILRDLKISDANALSIQGNDLDINFFTWYITNPFTTKDAKKLIEKRIRDYKNKSRKIYEFVIILKSDDSLAGLISLYDIDRDNRKAKIGYWLGKHYRGQGYTSEALKLIIKYAFEKLKLNKISASVLVCNHKSNYLLKKFDFRRIGIRKEHKFLRGEFFDVYEWELLNRK